MTEEKDTILIVKNLSKYFDTPKGTVHAVTNVSFSIKKNEVFGIVGETGCGKSTTGRAILRLVEPTNGDVLFEDDNILNLSEKEMRNKRKDLRMIFQDPFSSLDPKMTVGEIIAEPLKIHNTEKLTKSQIQERVLDMMSKVGLRLDHFYRYPHEFSGGQRQRIGLARALILNPKLVVCDEPVSALDVSIQSQVLNLIRKMKNEMNNSYVFITHDMSVVHYISDRIGVMYLGQMVEEGKTEEIFSNPRHPYTKALLSAVPEANPSVKKERIVLHGEIPSPLNPPSGCIFHTRCKFCTEKCVKEEPMRREVSDGHFVSCHLFDK